MKSISLITANIVRDEKVKGEKYLVLHEEGENAEDVVLSYLSPFAKEPVKIVQKTLLKGNCEVIGNNESDNIFKGVLEYVTVDEKSGKERKTSSQFFIQAETIREAFDLLAEFANGFVSDAAITSIGRTKIIEVLEKEE